MLLAILLCVALSSATTFDQMEEADDLFERVMSNEKLDVTDIIAMVSLEHEIDDVNLAKNMTIDEAEVQLLMRHEMRDPMSVIEGKIEAANAAGRNSKDLNTELHAAQHWADSAATNQLKFAAKMPTPDGLN